MAEGKEAFLFFFERIFPAKPSEDSMGTRSRDMVAAGAT